MKVEITSKDNKNIKETIKLINSSKDRYKNKLFVIEGLRLCMDAYITDVHIKTVFYTHDAMLKHKEEIEKLISKSEQHYIVSDSIMKLLSDTQTPQGIVCVCTMLDKYITLDKIDINGKYIAFEDLKDPANLGTILRTLEALGFEAVILSRGCCDIYNSKVLRGSMGAVFRLKILKCDNIVNDIKILNNRGFRTYACVVDRTADYITGVNFKNGDIAIIGNEANGLTNEMINTCKYKITIPMLGKAESLNACAASNIVMWEMMRK